MPPSSDPSPVRPPAGSALRTSGVVAGPHQGVDELVLEARFVDHHVHGILRGALPADQLIRQLSESDRPAAAAIAGLDTQLGIAVRRWTAPLLGLEPGVPAADWLAHRSGLDNESVGRTMLPEAGVEALLVDTGFQGSTLTSPDELGALAGAPAREVVRLEAVAEVVAARRPSPTDWWDALRAELAVRTRDAVGVKSILAYRYGFDVDPAPPSDAEVAAAAGDWFRAMDSGAPLRIAHPTLLRAVVWAGVELSLPLQFHTGYGDSDLDLHRADPALLTGFLRLTQDRCTVLLLHTYPFQRTAGYLAQMFPHVYLDVGLGVNHSGAASGQIIRETLEIAPLTKVLFSSDAWGVPELHVLGSWLIRRGLSRILGAWVRDGDWTLADAARAIELFAGINARRVYTRL